jgi:hypothetical protein
MVKRTEKVETGDETSPVTSLKFTKYLPRAYSPAHACPADRGRAYSPAHARPQPARNPVCKRAYSPAHACPADRGRAYSPAHTRPQPARPGLQAGLRPYLARSRRAPPARGLPYSPAHARPQPNGCSSNSQLAVVDTAEPGLNVADDGFHTA